MHPPGAVGEVAVAADVDVALLLLGHGAHQPLPAHGHGAVCV